MTPSPCSPARSSRGWTRQPDSFSGTTSSRETRSRRASSAPGGTSRRFAIRIGTHLAFARFLNGEYQVAVVPVGGGGKAVTIGPRFSEGTAEPFLSFSPDGTMILATYPADGSTWLLGSDGGNETQVPWPEGEFLSWQRLAP